MEIDIENIKPPNHIKPTCLESHIKPALGSHPWVKFDSDKLHWEWEVSLIAIYLIVISSYDGTTPGKLPVVYNETNNIFLIACTKIQPVMGYAGVWFTCR